MVKPVLKAVLAVAILLPVLFALLGIYFKSEIEYYFSEPVKIATSSELYNNDSLGGYQLEKDKVGCSLKEYIAEYKGKGYKTMNLRMANKKVGLDENICTSLSYNTNNESSPSNQIATGDFISLGINKCESEIYSPRCNKMIIGRVEKSRETIIKLYNKEKGEYYVIFSSQTPIYKIKHGSIGSSVIGKNVDNNFFSRGKVLGLSFDEKLTNFKPSNFKYGTQKVEEAPLFFESSYIIGLYAF